MFKGQKARKGVCLVCLVSLVCVVSLVSLASAADVQYGSTTTAPDGSRRLQQDSNTSYTCPASENSMLLVNNIHKYCENGVLYSPRMNKDSYASSAVPAITSCGNGSPAAETGSTNLKGAVTIGATGTGCTITFAAAFSNAPACTVTCAVPAAASTGIAATASTTAITISQAAPGRCMYICSSLNE